MKTPLYKIVATCLFMAAAGASTSLLGQSFVGQNIGAPTHTGGITNNGDGSFWINGGGADIYGTADGGFYYSAPITGLIWEAKMRVMSFDGPDQWSKVGLMVRRPATAGGATAADDPEIMNLTTRAAGRNDTGTQHRSARAGNTQDHQNLGPGGASITNSAPNLWLRVTRTNTFFTCFYSTNGTTWVPYTTYRLFETTSTGAANVDPPGFGAGATAWEDPILVGVAVTAHNDGDVNGATALISNLTVTVTTPVAPTAAGVVSQIQGTTNVYAYAEANFGFRATNNANPSILYGMDYIWYKNGTAVTTNSGTNYTFLTTSADNGASILCVARVANPAYYSITVTSAVLTLTAKPGAVIYNDGLKQEFFAGGDRTRVENGNVPLGAISKVTAASLGAQGLNYGSRLSGYFRPPSSGAYNFFIASDDDADLFISLSGTDPATKVLIAQETVNSNPNQWVTSANSIVSQKNSASWSPDGGITTPYSGGISLSFGTSYYIEVVHHQGGGGDSLGVTYRNVTAGDFDPVDGDAPKLNAASNNISLITWPGTNLSWTLQPGNLTVVEGATAVFNALAASDAEMAVVYSWFLNSAPYPGVTGPQLAIPSVTLALNGASIQVVATSPGSGLSITSSVATLTVNQAVLETGFAKDERWDGVVRSQVENGTAGTPGYVMGVPGFEVSIDNPGTDSNFSRRVSGFFIPPTTASYTFFVNGDDDTDLFVSTDVSPANKRLVCQETTWSNPFNWTGANAGSVTQKRSDSWSPDNNVTIPWALGIPLTAGQKYYIEMVFHQGGGGANCEATYKLTTDPDPIVGADTRFKGSQIAINAPKCTFVAFSQQPTNKTVNAFELATFNIVGTTDSQLAVGAVTGNEGGQTNNFLIYQWQKNGIDIPGATARVLTYGPVLPSDSGAIISCRIRALGFSDNSLNPIWSNSTTATLTVNPAVFESGWAQVEWWSTGAVTRAQMENNVVGPAQYFYATPAMIAPSGSSLDNYGNRVRAMFTPPATADYVFFMNSDDDSDLFLSTDSSPANKVLIAREVGWSGTTLGWSQTGGGGDTLASRRSDQFIDPALGTTRYPSGIHLIGGQQYFMEAVHHEGGGGDYFAATYTLFGDPVPANGIDTVLRGNVIGFYAPRIPFVAFIQQPTNTTATSGGNSATFSASGYSAPSIRAGTTGNPAAALALPGTNVVFQWYKNGTPIAGATAASYTQTPILPSDNGAQFTVGIRNLGYSDNSLNPIYSNSSIATLTVVTDTVPPVLTYSATFQNTNPSPGQLIVNVTFNEWMDATSLSNIANYSISGVTITGVSVGPDHRTVQLLVNTLPTLPVNVTVSGVKDLSGNTIVPSSTTAINPERLTFSDIGTPGTDPAYPSYAWVTAGGGYIIQAQGHDIWDSADGFNFAWEAKTNDFDVAVRGVSITKTATAAKMGLMVREDLTAGSRNWSVVNDPSSADGIPAIDGSGNGANNVECNMRETNSTPTRSWKSTGNNAPTYPNAWVRIKRIGSILEAYTSPNKVNWTLRGRYDTATNGVGALPSVVYVGLATTAHNNDALVGPPPFRFYNTAEYASYNTAFVVPVVPVLSISTSGGNAIVSWTGSPGMLQSSPAVAGPSVNWVNVGTSNPATIPLGAGPQFYRVQLDNQ